MKNSTVEILIAIQILSMANSRSRRVIGNDVFIGGRNSTSKLGMRESINIIVM